MNLTFAAAAVLVTTTLLAPPPPRPSSDPVGVYATIDKVVLLPNGEAPTEAEIHGAFCVARGAGDYYTAPVRGVLVFRAGSKPADEVTQWRELGKLAGTSQVIGFSSRWEQAPALRVAAPGEARPAAVTYPVGWGLQKVEGIAHGAARELSLLPRPISPLADSAPKAKARETRPARQLTFTVENCTANPAPSHYLFEVETASGDLLASPAIAPGDKTTSWTTQLALLAGDKITWRVRVLEAGKERVPVASASFVVGTEGEDRR